MRNDVLQLRRAGGASGGEVVAWYAYNAWGYLIASGGPMAEVNPLRYRGYYYDTVLGMYYLQSRYYDPYIGRFVNVDAMWVLGVEQGTLLQFNLFAYCLNNPVNGVDPSGYFFKAIVGGAILGAVVSSVVQVTANFATGRNWRYGVLDAAIGGAVAGALGAVPGAKATVGSSVVTGVTAGYTGNVAVQLWNRESNVNRALVGGALGGLLGPVTRYAQNVFGELLLEAIGQLAGNIFDSIPPFSAPTTSQSPRGRNAAPLTGAVTPAQFNAYVQNSNPHYIMNPGW